MLCWYTVMCSIYLDIELERKSIYSGLFRNAITWSHMLPFKCTQTKYNTLFSIHVKRNVSDWQARQGEIGGQGEHTKNIVTFLQNAFTA